MKELFVTTFVPVLVSLSALSVRAEEDVLAMIPPPSIQVPVTAFVVRDYGALVTLGIHVPSREPMYPHRSSRIEYSVNCGAGVVAMRGWQLFSAPRALGDVVWADRNYGASEMTAPQTDEERDVVSRMCSGGVLSLR